MWSSWNYSKYWISIYREIQWRDAFSVSISVFQWFNGQIFGILWIYQHFIMPRLHVWFNCVQLYFIEWLYGYLDRFSLYKYNIHGVTSGLITQTIQNFIALVWPRLYEQDQSGQTMFYAKIYFNCVHWPQNNFWPLKKRFSFVFSYSLGRQIRKSLINVVNLQVSEQIGS